MKDINKIISKLKKLKPELEKNYQITELGVFGSFVRGEQTSQSDIDILIDYKDGTSILTLGGLQYMLSELFNTKVDIVMKRTLKKQIGKQILSEVVYV
ncbi:MAG: nucleotidyltransferase family protein [Candidatus Gastranaerophilaceae bacterium]